MTSTETTISYRAAGLDDLAEIVSLFGRMLQDLQPLGHDILPTERNIVLCADHIFAPALLSDNHGIVLAMDGSEIVGASFFVPDQTPFQVKGKRSVAYGIWVDPGYRKRGIALALQEIAHNRLKERGFDSLISVVVYNNKAGLASCRKAGAKITGYFTTVYL